MLFPIACDKKMKKIAQGTFSWRFLTVCLHQHLKDSAGAIAVTYFSNLWQNFGNNSALLVAFATHTLVYSVFRTVKRHFLQLLLLPLNSGYNPWSKGAKIYHRKYIHEVLIGDCLLCSAWCQLAQRSLLEIDGTAPRSIYNTVRYNNGKDCAFRTLKTLQPTFREVGPLLNYQRYPLWSQKSTRRDWWFS